MKKAVFQLVFGLIVLTTFNSCGVAGRMLVRGVPNVTDYKFFRTDSIEAPRETFQFARKVTPITLPDPALWTVYKKEYTHESVDDFMEMTGTSAFLIIRNDSILFEKYYNDYHRDSLSQIFSLTKAITTTLIGIAIDEGKIESIEQPVSDFIPEFANDDRSKIKVKHMLQMTTGLNFNDRKNLIKLSRLYYHNNAKKYMYKIGMKYDPGINFDYSSMTTFMLGHVLEVATGQSFAEYLQEKLWEPLEMKNSALMNVTKKAGDAQAFGGLASTAIDIAKFGRLYLNKGNWNGQQLVSEDWISHANIRDTTEGSWWGYNYGFWMNTNRELEGYYKEDRSGPPPNEEVMQQTEFFAAGYKAQMLYMNPDHNTMIIRMGIHEKDVMWRKCFPVLCELVNNNIHTTSILPSENK